MTFPDWFTPRHPQISVASAAAVLKLADEGATVPFIARYRKEETGNLDEVAIRQVIDAMESWDEILKRQTFIVEEIERQGKLTPELKDQLLATFELTVLEDLYLPYKQKRKTKATVAKEAGLEPLATWLWECGHGMLSPAPEETPRSARAGVLRCRQGRRRRRRRACGGQRHPRRAAVGGRRPSADGAQRVLRAGPRADAKGGQGQAEQPLRELLRLPGVRRRAVEAAQLASLPGHAPRVDGGGAGAVGGRRAPRRQARGRIPRWEEGARGGRSDAGASGVDVRRGGVQRAALRGRAAAHARRAHGAARPTSSPRSRTRCTRRSATSPTRRPSRSSPRTSGSSCSRRRSAPRRCSASIRACAPDASWPSSTARALTWARA